MSNNNILFILSDLFGSLVIPKVLRIFSVLNRT